jgi:predicted N-acetyltransferase YhbS
LLVERLRQAGRLIISLVAEFEGRLVGHIAFSPVTIKHSEEIVTGAGLAPLALHLLWRFGFQTASRHGVTNVYGIDEPFMLMELRADSVKPGIAHYAPEFAALS